MEEREGPAEDLVLPASAAAFQLTMRPSASSMQMA